ncbi:MAG: hypothetical protein VKJ02_17990 [Snowella sp.]|nr:hypothetical protein [Snowella sp.]
MEITLTERIESLKAGGIAGAAFSVAYGICVLGNQSLGILTEETIIKFAIAALSGFLFGVTYRYIIRTDSNPHLKDGAVLAFSLVRGGGIAETTDHLLANGFLVSVLLIEGLICFAIARSCLDIALSRQWLKPFL